MVGHSGPKRPSRKSVAINEMAPLMKCAKAEGPDDFLAPLPPLPAPRKKSSFGASLKYFLDTADEVHRMRASLQERLPSETARAMSRKKWLAHDIRKAQALEHVARVQLPNRTAAAWEIVEFMQKRFGETVSWKTAYKWLPPIGRRRAGE